nr:MAG TPA: hypothetical protein [Caudoviricetes sp.]
MFFRYLHGASFLYMYNGGIIMLKMLFAMR